jgi:hypothetical protein
VAGDLRHQVGEHPGGERVTPPPQVPAMRCKGGALTLGVTQFLHVRVDEHRLDEPTEGLFPEAGIDPWMALGAT